MIARRGRAHDFPESASSPYPPCQSRRGAPGAGASAQGAAVRVRPAGTTTPHTA